MRFEPESYKKKKLIVLRQDLTPNSGGPLNILGLVIVVIACLVFQVDRVSGADYELTRDNVEDPKMVDAEEVSLYQVKLGDPEAQAIKLLVEGKISGIRAEQEEAFILLWDTTPQGPWPESALRTGKSI